MNMVQYKYLYYFLPTAYTGWPKTCTSEGIREALLCIKMEAVSEKLISMVIYMTQSNFLEAFLDIIMQAMRSTFLHGWDFRGRVSFELNKLF